MREHVRQEDTLIDLETVLRLQRLPGLLRTDLRRRHQAGHPAAAIVDQLLHANEPAAILVSFR